MSKKNKQLVCARYNEVGDCVKFVLVDGRLEGSIIPEARVCAKELANKAEQLIRAGKVHIKI